MQPKSALSPTPYPDLNRVLAEFVSRVQAVLGDRFTAAYLVGSFAIGDFDTHSDVDFLIAMEEEVAEHRLPELQKMHGRIHELDSPWSRHLDGSYIPLNVLRKHDPTNTPLLYLDNGSKKLVRSDHCNKLVVRWMARERGITLAGPEPCTLIDPIPAAALCREVRRVMRGWAREIDSDPQQMSRYQPYAVLGYCRMLYTLDTGTIVSKPTAANWALNMLEPGWQGLIRRAQNQRPETFLRAQQPADPAEVELTRAFIAYALGVGAGHP